MAKKKQKEAPGNNILSYFIITGLTAFIIFANSLGNDFVFDDESVVQGDVSITSLSNIPKYFTGEQGFHKVIGRYYRPVVSTTYAVDYAVWGLKPFGFHFTNVLIHVINSLLFLKLLLLLFGNYQSKFKDYAILIGALIFAVHPVHTEAVSWVSGRTDSISCTFFFAALIYYLKFLESDTNKNLVLLLLFYLLSLLSKEMAITLPVVIILYDLIINKLSIRNLLSERLKVYSAVAIVSVLYLLMRWYVLKDVPERTTYNYFYGKDAFVTLFTMLQTIPLYFRLNIVPYDMLYHYNGYLPYRDSFSSFPVLFAIAFIILFIICAFYLRKKLPVVSFSIFFFFITMLPVVNIIPTMNFMAERFLYIPSIIVSFAFIAIALKYYSEKNVNIIYGIAVVLLVGYGFLTVSRNADWKNNDTLYMTGENRPGTVTYVNIGNIYANKQQYDKGAEYYRKAIELKKEAVLANNNLGKVFLIKRDFDSAYFYINRAHLNDTLSPEPLHAMATLYASFDRYNEAIDWLERLQKVTPGYMNSDKMLAELKARQQVPQNQQQQMPNINSADQQKLAMLEQSSYQNYQNKNYDKAIEELKELIKLNPAGASGCYNNIGMCYMDQAKYDDAINSFELSVKANPSFATALNNLGYSYEKSGHNQKALEFYKKAVTADPTNQNAKDNLERLQKQ